jgi:hypothetical protein
MRQRRAPSVGDSPEKIDVPSRRCGVLYGRNEPKFLRLQGSMRSRANNAGNWSSKFTYVNLHLRDPRERRRYGQGYRTHHHSGDTGSSGVRNYPQRHDFVVQAHPDGAQHWEFIIVNTGSTTGSLSGLVPGSTNNSVQAVGYTTVAPATLPWATGWTIEIGFQSNYIAAYGETFAVEILN